MINPNQRNLHMGRISQNTRIYALIGNIFFVKKPRSILHYYKNPKNLEIKVRIIYPNFGSLELWKFANLTFGGYLAGTTPVLSIVVV